MGHLKGETNRSEYDSEKGKRSMDSSDDETQQIDGDDLAGSEDDDFLCVTDTVPAGDTYQVEDEFETEMVSLAGETQRVYSDEEIQSVDSDEETQRVDLAGETQVLDDLDCTKNMDMEFFNELNDGDCPDSEDEETSSSDVILETQDLSRDESVKSDDFDSVGVKSRADKDPSIDGSLCGGFTSIRAASIRASGLAAIKASLEKDLNSDGKHNREKLRNSNKSKVGSRAVRQLFKDDEVSDSETDNNEISDNLDVPERLASEDCVAGLSYANSQEPGALSQKHALDVVDKFLDLNFMDCDKSFGRKVAKSEKIKVASAAKGSHDLAKSSTVEDCAVYDWDDAHEDDGGGEFFLKKKELFFQEECLKRRGHTELRKLKNSRDPMYSDSGVMLNKLRSSRKSLHCGEEVLQKNLTQKFCVMSGDKLAIEDLDKDVSDMRNIGPDTQMAAEAMEGLCFEVHLPEISTAKAAKGKKLRKRMVRSEENSKFDNVGVLTRQGKHTKRISTSNKLSTSPIKSKNIRKKRDRVVDVNVSDCRPETTVERSEEKNEVEDHLHFCVPVAHRTRKSSLSANRLKVPVCLVEDREGGSAGLKQSNKKCVDASGDSSINSSVKTRSSKKGAVQCDSDHSKATAVGASTPVNRTTPKTTVSPICMGDEYHKQSCSRRSLRLSLLKEIDDLSNVSPKPLNLTRESRKRKDISSVRVLFSQHLDADVVQKQKKILERLGGAVASAMVDATHFVADEFFRTRNILEAIAFGKPVVSSLWIKSCGQASCLIDEKNYILRDAKKEKEFGFSLPVTLARACQHPLLQGRKVLITPNTKPGKDILANLVRAVQGLVVDKLDRSVSRNNNLPDDLLILSCEADRGLCDPFLEKGVAIYSSELLLNGIVKQKLEYKRHRLFVDGMKRTR